MFSSEYVENHLVAFEPEAVLPYLAPNVQALYTNRNLIRLAPCTDFVVEHIATLILNATESGARFRKYECLRNIRQIIRGSKNPQLGSKSVELLFQLYRHYIYSEKEEIQWCVTTYLKDRQLSSDQIDWLIDNAHTSSHLVNRLLRYPEREESIAVWAFRALSRNCFPERSAELLGLLIDDALPALASGLPTDTVLWAIYYSRAPLLHKSRMLCATMKPECADATLTIAMRLRLPDVIRALSEILPEGVLHRSTDPHTP